MLLLSKSLHRPEAGHQLSRWLLLEPFYILHLFEGHDISVWNRRYNRALYAQADY